MKPSTIYLASICCCALSFSYADESNPPKIEAVALDSVHVSANSWGIPVGDVWTVVIPNADHSVQVSFPAGYYDRSVLQSSFAYTTYSADYNGTKLELSVYEPAYFELTMLDLCTNFPAIGAQHSLKTQIACFLGDHEGILKTEGTANSTTYIRKVRRGDKVYEMKAEVSVHHSHLNDLKVGEIMTFMNSLPK